jgi:hypothetical protein
VAEVLKMEGYVTRGRTLADDLPWRRANCVYLSQQARRKGTRKLEGTPDLIRQDDESFVEVIDTVVT